MRRLRAATLFALLSIAAACARPAPPKAQELNVLVASYDLAVGDDQRFMVGLVTSDERLVTEESAELSFAYTGTREGEVAENFSAARRAKFLPIPESSEPTHLTGVYKTTASFDRAGFWQVRARAEALEGTGTFEVLEKHQVPAPGDPAPKSENYIVGSEVSNAALDSRAARGPIPDPELHRVTIADAISRGRPALVVFSTPEFCISRFCGPVTDLIADLASEHPERAEYIHVEIWEDQPARKFNPTAEEWLLHGDLQEPWVFLIGADGRIAARWDNVATREEIEPLLTAL